MENRKLHLDQELRYQKKLKYRGTARIDLSNLEFIPDNISRDTYVRKKVWSNLVDIFKLEDCLRLPQDHHIDALISSEALRTALARSNTSIEALQLDRCDRYPPKLLLLASESLPCLNGRKRLKAARAFLEEPGDDWWIVDLYSDGKSALIQ